MSETWRPDKSDIWGAGKNDSTHGVGIMLNRKWRQKIIDTEYINERAVTATIVVNHQRIKLMKVYFTHSGYADYHVEKCAKTAYRLLEETLTLRLDQDTELDVQVLVNTHSTEGYKISHSTRCTERLLRNERLTEEQVDYIIINR